MRICIDAGHGGSDTGAVGIDGRFEKNDALKFTKALSEKLRAAGVDVLETRTGDTYPSLSDRVNMANETSCDYFISIHRNAYDDPGANGFECLLSVNASTKSEQMASAIQNHVIAVGGRNRGVKKQSTRVYVLDKTNMPATTVELGFVTNAGDNKLFDTYFSEYVNAVYEGIIEASGFKPVTNQYVAIKDTIFIISATTIKAGSAIDELLAYPVKTASLNSNTVARARFNGQDGLIVFADFKKGE